MADYCAIDDVNKLVPQQPFTPDSIPTDDDVRQFITDCSQELNCVLGNLGYTVPVVGAPIALNQLRRAAAWGALGIAQDARMTAVLRDDMVSGGKNVWTVRFEGFKKALQDPNNPYELTDAARNDKTVVKPLGQLQSSTVDSLSADGTAPQNQTYSTNPPFFVGMKF